MSKLKTQNSKVSIIVLFIIICLASFLRFYKLGEVPEGINRDEAGIGYNAYTILKTGKDEYGNKFPLYFKSFGDWKMPVYIYLTVPSVALFGLNEFSVRFPSAFFGTLTVLFLYFLTKELFQNYTSEVRRRRDTTSEEFLKPQNLNYSITNYLPIIASLLLAISPWHIDYSRQAYEPTLAIFWLVLGAYFLTKNSRISILLIFPCFVLSIFTYHTTILLTLIIFIYLLMIAPKSLIKTKKKILYSCIIFILLILSQILEIQGVKDKLVKQTLFNDKSLILERVILIRDIHQNNEGLTRFFHNRIWEGLLMIGENYFKTLSADFLFFGNDPYPRFTINKKSLRLNFLILMPFLMLGIYQMIRKIKKYDDKIFFPLIWFFAVPILPSIVSRSPSSYRILPIVIPICIISAFGINYSVNLFKKTGRQKFIIIILAAFLLLDFIKITEEYVFHLDGGLEYQYGKLINFYNLISNKRQKELSLVVARPEESPYIFIAFYQKIEPEWFLANIKRYPTDEYGFEHVAQLGEKYQFKPIVWNELKENTSYINLYHQVPEYIRNSKQASKDYLIIKNKIGEPLFFEYIN